MKKKFAVIIAAVMVLSLVCCSALAAGKMTVTQENFHAVDMFSVYGYAFAKVENTGDKPVKFSAGLLEIYDSNGDTLESTDYVNCYPKTLNPGETGYAIVDSSVDNAAVVEDLADYALTITGKSDNGTVKRFPATGKFEPNVKVSDYWTENYLTAEITNDTDETAFKINVVVAILDDSNNILFAEENQLYSIGINPGSTITYRDTLGDYWLEAWEREGLTPTHVEVIAYVDSDPF